MINEYFQDYAYHYWEYEDSGEIIVIPFGNTIIYTKHIGEIIAEIAAQGLPSFGSMILVLIALSPSRKINIESSKHIISSTEKTSYDTEIKEVFLFLERLSEIPDEYNIGKRKILLFKTLFEDCHNKLSNSKSKKIKKYVVNQNKLARNSSKAIKRSQFRNDLKVVALLNRKFPSNEAIIQKMGELPELEEEMVFENEEEFVPQDYIDELIENPRTRKIGSLVKSIWAGLNIPLRSSSPSQQPIGGVSDLTNKGNYDQLLISEYANDDLVFLSRLANNEALFLNREKPPQESDMRRVIFIDITLKNWGTPKILAFAAMLAIAKHPKTAFSCEVYLVGNGYQKIDFDTVTGVIDALQMVDQSLDSSEGVVKYFRDNPENNNSEVFLLTEHSVVKTENMMRCLSEFNGQINFIIHSDHAGGIDVYKNLRNNKKHTQHLEIPIQKLWSKKIRTKKSKISVEPTTSDYYPILFPLKLTKYRGIRTLENGAIYLLSKNRSLFRVYDNTKYPAAWELISENLPIKDSIFELGVINDELIILTYHRQMQEVCFVNIKTKETSKFKIANCSPLYTEYFIFFDKHFYCWREQSFIKIHFDGTQEKTDLQLNSYFKERYRQIIEIPKQQLYSSSSILTNVSSVGIGKNNSIILNSKFSLWFTINKDYNHETVRIIKSTEKEILLSNKEGKSLFQFKDGSTVEIKQFGLLILTSSDKSIPTIHILSVLDTLTSIATETEFAGLDDFLFKPQYEIILQDIGESKVAIVKTLTALTEINLNYARNIVYSSPCNLSIVKSYEEACKIKSELEKAGATIDIIPSNATHTKMKKISIEEFKKKYIDPFIQTISHGA